ncbi:MAG: hypothetical protein SNJ67_08370 [Chloracidobacterium sp.]|uniref:(2Fe-2S) ferredoxin domain-containing protein n=1 Tax=Chloracidobacterium validum TaxID=2821543 RepID=A0ABX8B767_9BACT|nr:hypothetical protein [Chloracidobacterium validum]QUW01896.1 hypothetical protein J8C06_05815 [Chloracidobacterium validum]
MSELLFDTVKFCSSCARRATDGDVAALGARIRPLFQKQLEKEGLGGCVAMSSRPCFAKCPDNGITVALGTSDESLPREVYIVASLRDLDYVYARLRGEV